MQPFTKDVQLGDLTVPVREISIAEIRAWLKGLEARSKDGEIELYSVERDLFEDLTLADLPLFTGLPVEAFDELAPSQVREVIAVVKELNPDFFGMRGRMRTAADQLLGFLRNAGKTSNAQPVF